MRAWANRGSDSLNFLRARSVFVFWRAVWNWFWWRYMVLANILRCCENSTFQSRNLRLKSCPKTKKIFINSGKKIWPFLFIWKKWSSWGQTLSPQKASQKLGKGRKPVFEIKPWSQAPKGYGGSGSERMSQWDEISQSTFSATKWVMRQMAGNMNI